MISSEQRVFPKLKKRSAIHVVGVTGVEGAAVASFLLAEGFKNLVGHAMCEGKDFERELLSHHKLGGADRKRELLDCVRGWGIERRLGDDYLRGIEEADVIFAPQSWELHQQANAPLFVLRPKLLNIMHLYLDLAPCATIGVTGSDGKTTTTHLIAHLLNSAGRKAWLSGNYREGEQILSRIRELDPDGFLVLEVSNRHLNFGLAKHPDIAVVTNVTQNHMTEYENFVEYCDVKERLLGSESVAVLNADNACTRHMGDHCKERLLFSRYPDAKAVGAFVSKMEIHDVGGFICDVSDICLPGEHNLENALAAITVVRSLGLSGEEISSGLKTFCAVPERLEIVAEINGRTIVNDLAATSMESARRAVEAYAGKPFVLVVGGETKGVDYEPFARTVQRVGAVIVGVQSEVTDVLKALGIPIETHSTVREAVKVAFEKTPRGGTLLLSPAGAFFQSRLMVKEGLSVAELISSLQSHAP